MTDSQSVITQVISAELKAGFVWWCEVCTVFHLPNVGTDWHCGSQVASKPIESESAF